MPGAQLKQVDAPSCEEVPAEQLAQDGALACENVPAEQLTQFTEEEVLKVPAEHAVHADEPALDVRPAEHETHEDDEEPPLELYVFGGHECGVLAVHAELIVVGGRNCRLGVDTPGTEP